MQLACVIGNTKSEDNLVKEKTLTKLEHVVYAWCDGCSLLPPRHYRANTYITDCNNFVCDKCAYSLLLYKGFKIKKDIQYPSAKFDVDKALNTNNKHRNSKVGCTVKRVKTFAYNPVEQRQLILQSVAIKPLTSEGIYRQNRDRFYSQSETTIVINAMIKDGLLIRKKAHSAFYYARSFYDFDLLSSEDKDTYKSLNELVFDECIRVLETETLTLSQIKEKCQYLKLNPVRVSRVVAQLVREKHISKSQQSRNVCYYSKNFENMYNCGIKTPFSVIKLLASRYPRYMSVTQISKALEIPYKTASGWVERLEFNKKVESKNRRVKKKSGTHKFCRLIKQ